MTRFLGLDGDIGFEGVDFAQHWNSYLLTDDFVNVNTGVFDPRHMFGMTNQGILSFFCSLLSDLYKIDFVMFRRFQMAIAPKWNAKAGSWILHYLLGNAWYSRVDLGRRSRV